MNTQDQKQELVILLNRNFSDITWYRLRKHLKYLGCESEEDFKAAFQLIAAMNKGRNRKNSKIAIIPYGFVEVWESVTDMCKRPNTKNMTFTCIDFVNFITKNEDIKPKDRFIQGKRIGINTIWYRWFSSCGLSFEMQKRYNFDVLIPVVALYYSWKYKQANMLNKAVIDVEISEVVA